MRYAFAAFSLALTVNPASAQGAPTEVWFHEDQAATADKLANLCANRGASVVEQDDHHILCTRDVTGMRGVLAQALLGNSYSTSPVLMVRFAIMKDGIATRVQASQWVELQMAMGQTRRTPISGAKNEQQMVDELVGAGGTQLPPDLWKTEAAVPQVGVPASPPPATPTSAAPTKG